MERRSTILLVEDNPDDVFFFERVLRECRRDYDLHVLRSGDEAIDYVQRECRGGEVPGFPLPKFIIVDNDHNSHTPRMDFLCWISKNRIYEEVPTVVLSGSDQPSEVKLAFHLGVHGYFVKPVGKTELLELLKMIFHYWAESSLPPVKEYQFTAEGEQAMLKTERG